MSFAVAIDHQAFFFFLEVFLGMALPGQEAAMFNIVAVTELYYQVFQSTLPLYRQKGSIKSSLQSVLSTVSL